MPKISALPAMTAPDTADPAPVVDDSVSTTKKLTLGGMRDWLYSLVNIPAGPASPVTRDDEHFFDHVSSGCIWSGDAYASTRNASMTAGVVYINGRRISISAVTARSFTASRDTYIDVLDNGDGTGTLVYTEVTNNNASPALASNSLRIGIIVTGASNIASVGSVNQGQKNKLLPIASSIPYAVTDSLGNRICNRDPRNTLLGQREKTADESTANATATALTGMTLICKIPANRKYRIELYTPSLSNNTLNAFAQSAICLNSASDANRLTFCNVRMAAAGGFGAGTSAIYHGENDTASEVTLTIVPAFSAPAGGGTTTFAANAAGPAVCAVTLE